MYEQIHIRCPIKLSINVPNSVNNTQHGDLSNIKELCKKGQITVI